MQIGNEDKETIISLFGEHVSSGKARIFKTFEMDLVIGKREGIRIWDINGKELIDCHCNGGVFNLGHRNPEIIETLKNALNELDIGNHHLISKERALLAEMLSSLLPGDINRVVYGVGGGEAVDLAIKIARGYTRRKKIISAIGGYHGHTGFSLATGDEKYRKPFGPLAPGFIQVPFNDLNALEVAIDRDTAGVIFETVPATYGIFVPDKDFFKEVKRLCEKKGALLIIDEIQTGFGRTGKLWGIEHFGVVPDIIVLGKGMSGGIYPITATCFRDELETVFRKDPFIHVSTFGGSELGCVVARKVLEISSSEKFLKHVNDMAEFFKKELNSIKEEYPDMITEIRQLGMMMGIKMKNELMGPLMTKACFDSGLLCIYANNDRSVVQFLPPLIIKREEAEEVISRLKSALELAGDTKYRLRVGTKFIKAQFRNAFEYMRVLLKV